MRINIWPKGGKKQKKGRKEETQTENKNFYPSILEFKPQKTEWQNNGKSDDDKPEHPLLTATDDQTQRNTGKTMSK